VTFGVLLTTMIIAVIIALLNPVMGLLLTAVFGALISAIDPVAVIALFNENHVSARLETLIEGESLLNDGTAIVIFAIVLQATQSGGDLNVFTGLLDFARVAFGGLLVGGIIGYLMARLLYHINDPIVEMMLTTCLAFGSYLVAEQFHVSGVLAVVAAGLMHGYTGFSNMSELTKQTVNIVWAYLAALANAAIFLLIGITINLEDILSNLPLVALAIFAVLVSRMVIVYGLAPLHTRIFHSDRPLPMSWRHVMFWGGQRGAVSLALALSLPVDLPQRDSLLIMTFGVVLFTSLVQATSMPWIIQRLDLSKDQWQGDENLPEETL
jgi:CPA1 family monovalent cation:H+ antiporter